MEGLSIDVGVPTDDGQYEGVICHDYVNVVGVLGNSIVVCDGEWDEVEPIISYESSWDV